MAIICIYFINSLSLGITLHDEALDWAAAGDHVSLTVTGMDIIKIKWVCKEKLDSVIMYDISSHHFLFLVLDVYSVIPKSPSEPVQDSEQEFSSLI